MYCLFCTASYIGAIALLATISSCSSKSPTVATAVNNTNVNVTASEIASTANTTSITPEISSNAAPNTTVIPVPMVSALNPVSHSSQAQTNTKYQLAKLSNRRSGVKICPTFPCLVLSTDPNNFHNSQNNPIYKLTAYHDSSTQAFQFAAVTGRSYTQNRNRYQSGTEAPLPDGSYSVAPRVVKGTIVEVGGTMLPIFPKPGFNARMRRTELGIHWDPSFDKDNNEDGTSGCVGLTRKSDYLQVRNFVLKYHPRSLEVRIDVRS